MRNFVNFHPTTQKSKNFTSMSYFCPKYIRFELKTTEELSFMALNIDAKMAWEIGWTFIRALKRLKNCTLMGCFCQKHIMFQLKISEELCVITLKDDAKFKEKLTLWFVKWHEEFGKFSSEQTKVSKLGLSLGPFIQSRKCMSLKFTVGLCVLWQWRMMQTLKRNWLISSRVTWEIYQFKTGWKIVISFYKVKW